VHIKIAQIASLVLYFSILVFLIFFFAWNINGMFYTGTVVISSALTILICMVIDLTISKIEEKRI